MEFTPALVSATAVLLVIRQYPPFLRYVGGRRVLPDALRRS
jgi:hypothetical protein